MTLQPGDPVILNVPQNPRLHGAKAAVGTPTDWGAHLFCPAAATGRFRATHEEMVLFVDDAPLTHDAYGKAMMARNGNGTFTSKATSVTQGYTGDVCCCCQGVRMRRNGACLICDDCGTQGGCG